MRLNACIAGVGMTRFMKYPDKGLKELGTEAATAAIADAGLETGDLEAAYVGNCAAGLVTGQESIRGQVVLDTIGIGKIPIINVENACASGSTALSQACMMISAGVCDVALALGVEKLTHPDKMKSFAAFAGAVDVDEVKAMLDELSKGAKDGDGGGGAGQNRSMFMDVYASAARAHMERHGTTAEQFAAVAAKNSYHGSLNPRAQFQQEMTLAEVLESREIIDPLTLPMCSPIGDGAAALVLVSERKAREMGLKNPVRVLSSVLVSGWDLAEGDRSVGEYAAHQAYEAAGVGPEDISLVELHDASAPSEVISYDYLGICEKGQGGRLIEDGSTRLGGRVPVNVSGGLLRKGHPIGATGAAQIVEITEQLQGRSNQRQVDNARIGLAHNGGGLIGVDAAATVVSILGRED